jgi:hypothetical protein
MQNIEEPVSRQRLSVDPLADLFALLATHNEPRHVTGAQLQAIEELDLVFADLMPADGKVALASDSKVALEQGSQLGPLPPHSLGASDLRLDSAGVSTPHPLQTITTHPTSATPSPLPAPSRQTPKRTPLTVEGKKARRAQRTIASIIRDTSWKRASAFEKFAASILIAQKAGGSAFSVNLNELRRMSLGGASPARRVADWFNRAFKEAGVSNPLYSFKIELSREGAPHLHGVCMHDEATTKAILKKVGGEMSGHEASRQVRVRDVHHADGWVEYLRKDIRAVTEELWDERPCFVSRALQQATASAWGEIRGQAR